MDKTDIDIIKEREVHKHLKDHLTGKPIEYTIEEFVSVGFGSLLWDGCKECGIKL